jgi:hypothetical protein
MIPARVVEKITELCEENSIARTLVRLPVMRAWNRTETSVDWILSSLQLGTSPAARNEVIRFFKQLETAGAGKFLVGRRGSASRFIWNYQPSELIRVVFPLLGSSGVSKGGGKAPAPHHETDTARDAQIPRSPGTEMPRDHQTLLIPHSFQLRPDLLVVLELPGDLTLLEAQRLSSFIGSLPFHLERG